MLTSMGHGICRYARYGDVSPKVDVYAFGVVLYELISAKDAIVRSTESSSDSKGLVYLVLLNQLFYIVKLSTATSSGIGLASIIISLKCWSLWAISCGKGKK
jgi:serine/threonine protein kinase